MAFTSFGAVNYEVEVPLSREYSRETVHPAGGRYGSEAQFKYMRHTLKSYRFKGMSAAATQACLSAKRAQYNRRFLGWTKNGSDWRSPSYLLKWGAASLITPDYFEQVASFNVIRRAVVFDVQIAIDEVVAIYGSWDYDLRTTDGVAACEARFMQDGSGAERLSYVSSYDYDENLT